MGGNLHRGQRVDEAGRQPAEAAVAQAGVRLRLGQLLQVQPLALHDLSDERVDHQVGDVVGQRPADEELHRQVIDALGILAVIGLFRLEPALGEQVADRAAPPPRNAGAR